MDRPPTRSPFRPRRRPTREVRVGDVGIGGANPLRVQSMTTTNTLDTAATVDQIERLAAAGCEIARVTAPSIRDAENLRAIQAELRRRRIRIPLVADIHYTPNAALEAAEHVEKVRVNPGNYVDKKKFEVREYSDAQWTAELDRAAARFRPLVRRCRDLGRALRIGTNHGSLSDRIMNRYGDTPRGMVESALEFLDVCEEEGYREVVFSMKASNPLVAIQAYRLLAARLAEREGSDEIPSYPIHLGVTEAGDGIDARVKSAIGIGALLEDGIGDTLRVSLTEDPVREIPVARALARRYEALWAGATQGEPSDPEAPWTDDPYALARRASAELSLGPVAFGGAQAVRAEIGFGSVPPAAAAAAERVERDLGRAAELEAEGLLFDVGDAAEAARAPALAEALEQRGLRIPLALRASLELAPRLGACAARWVVTVPSEADPAALREVARAAAGAGVALEWCLASKAGAASLALDAALDATPEALRGRLCFSVESEHPVHAARWVAARLRARGVPAPLVLRHRRRPEQADEPALLAAAADLGAPLCDGIGDAIALDGFAEPGRALEWAYRILQGARQRTSWTEFIACPSCGRTLFDLEETTERIRVRTGHLRGVKIAVMGCIVNGPGEMADADFGYVGSGPGRVNLYVGKTLVERGVPQAEADQRLVDLIRAHGRWIDPSQP